MAKPLTPARYSYSWALTVVQKAKNAHPRVADFWCEFHGLTDRQLARLIAEARPEWPELRRALKIFDNWLSHDRVHLLDRKWFTIMVEGTPVWFCTGLLKYLRDRNLSP
jgi:hypothetical protein